MTSVKNRECQLLNLLMMTVKPNGCRHEEHSDTDDLNQTDFTNDGSKIVDDLMFCLCFTAQSTQWGHVERGDLVLYIHFNIILIISR